MDSKELEHKYSDILNDLNRYVLIKQNGEFPYIIYDANTQIWHVIKENIVELVGVMLKRNVKIVDHVKDVTVPDYVRTIIKWHEDQKTWVKEQKEKPGVNIYLKKEISDRNEKELYEVLSEVGGGPRLYSRLMRLIYVLVINYKNEYEIRLEISGTMILIDSESYNTVKQKDIKEAVDLKEKHTQIELKEQWSEVVKDSSDTDHEISVLELARCLKELNADVEFESDKYRIKISDSSWREDPLHNKRIKTS